MPHRDSISARNDLFRLVAARRERARSCGEERALDAFQPDLRPEEAGAVAGVVQAFGAPPGLPEPRMPPSG
jgi:hypothetical protein